MKFPLCVLVVLLGVHHYHGAAIPLRDAIHALVAAGDIAADTPNVYNPLSQYPSLSEHEREQVAEGVVNAAYEMGGQGDANPLSQYDGLPDDAKDNVAHDLAEGVAEAAALSSRTLERLNPVQKLLELKNAIAEAFTDAVNDIIHALDPADDNNEENPEEPGEVNPDDNEEPEGIHDYSYILGFPKFPDKIV